MTDFLETIRNEFESIHAVGVYKDERILLSPQQARIRTKHGEVLNFCANNYLGLANHPEILEAARNALDQYGYGMSSVRFICGTQDVHKQLEKSVAKFLGMEDAILYSSCFDANGGLFETLLTEQDAVISDRLNHASIIDGVRLCKVSRFRYNHADMNHLETQLKRAQKNRFRMIATDGVFSMDGDVAPIKEICELAKRYQAIVMVDDSHATGFFGATGRGSIEYQDALGEVQIITSTFGKALGGASGGFTAASHELVSLLRQRSRPYLFSNSLSPVIAATTLKAIELIAHSPDLIRKLQDNTLFFRKEIEEAGFDIRPGSHPIIPIMLGEEHLAKTMADKLLTEGVYVIGFSHPVIPKGQARIRVQISAVHEREDIDQAVAAFQKIGRELGVIT